MTEPDVEIPDKGSIILSSEEDDMDEAMLGKTLDTFGVQHGTILVAEDFQQVNICLSLNKCVNPLRVPRIFD